MLNHLKTWLLIATLSVLSFTQAAHAFSFPPGATSYDDDNEDHLQDVKIESIDADDYEYEYCLSAPAEVTFGIYYEDGEGDTYKVHMFSYNEEKDEGCHQEEWDGKYGYLNEVGTKGNKVPNGKYFYGLKAEAIDDESYGSDFESDWVYVNDNEDNDSNDNEKKSKKKKTYSSSDDEPRLKEVYVTKEEFDPGQHESTYLVFTLTEKADVKVTAYDYDDKIETVWQKDNRSAGTYAIEWEADEVDEEQGTFSLRVEVENSEGEDEEEVSVKIKEDIKNKKKPNIIDDQVDQIPYNPKFNSLGISFDLDRDSEVTVEIRDESKVIATVIDDQDMVEGAHDIYWNGKDKYGEIADDGVYRYKIIAANKKGKDVEYGNFSVVETSKAKNLYDRCAGFEDLDENNKYCDAIEWAEENEIFKGYYDGTFKPNQAISRAEVLKVIFKALEVGVIEYNGENFGFTDLEYDWYSPYIKTALALGVINGYNDGTFRPHQAVNRAEALAMLLRTAQSKDGVIIPTNNYGQAYYDVPTGTDVWYLSYAWYAQIYNLTDSEYYLFPAQAMTRAEMADMLYRYYKNV